MTRSQFLAMAEVTRDEMNSMMQLLTDSLPTNRARVVILKIKEEHFYAHVRTKNII